MRRAALFQRFRLYGDIRRVLEESGPYLRANGLDIETVRQSLGNILYNAQPPSPLPS
ncbi:MAG: hypothetical protein HYY21_05675 [Candidatus Tectomicrobia bacterium]|nr:hypothetical protein [Candidatus Tectomicrobia bacterium]